MSKTHAYLFFAHFFRHHNYTTISFDCCNQRYSNTCKKLNFVEPEDLFVSL